MRTAPLVPVIYNFMMFCGRIKLLSIFSILCMMCATLGQLYCFISVFELTFFLKYSPFFFTSIYILMANMIHQALNRNLLSRNTKSLFRISMEATSSQIKRNLDATIMKMKKVFLIMTVSACVTVLVSVYQLNRHPDEFIAFSLMLHQHVSRDSVISILIHYVLYMALIIGGIIPSIAIPTYFIYAMFHIKIKMHLLIDYIHKLKNNLREMEQGRLGNNVKYHKYLMEELNVIVKQHLEIIRCNNEIMTADPLLYITYICSGILLGTASILQFFLPPTNLVQSFGAICNVLIYTYAMCDCGQDYINASMELFEALYELEWYNWDLECQKTFLILFAYSTKGISVTIFSMFDVGKELLKQICRIFYSVASLFYQIRDAQ